MKLLAGMGALIASVLASASAEAQFPPFPQPPPGYGPPAPSYGPPMPGAYQPPPQRRDETPAGAFGGAVLGFRAARLDADIDGADDTYGFMGSVAGVSVASVKFLAARLGLDLHVGGGEQGIEPRIAGQLTFGVIGHFAQTHGMFIRVGLGGDYEGNDRYTFSHFDLPLGEGGWQLHSDHVGIEVGARGGATLTGRMGIAPSGNRAFGVVGRWGGYVTVAASTGKSPFPGVWLDAEFMRLEDDTPIHVGSGRLCGGYIAFACIDGRLSHADLPFPESLGTPGIHEDVVTLYAGATLGVGAALAANGISAFTGF